MNTMTIDENLKQAVWEKGQIVSGLDPQTWRKDTCGAWINRDHHGDRKNDYGWEIDHIIPTANGGSDEFYNLRPLQWYNNVSRQDGQLVCKVKADGNRNYTKD